jgi:hypothetical protein
MKLSKIISLKCPGPDGPPTIQHDISVNDIELEFISNDQSRQSSENTSLTNNPNVAANPVKKQKIVGCSFVLAFTLATLGLIIHQYANYQWWGQEQNFDNFKHIGNLLLSRFILPPILTVTSVFYHSPQIRG